jgi:hypothetical protein
MTPGLVVGTCMCLQLEASLVTKVEDPDIVVLVELYLHAGALFVAP